MVKRLSGLLMTLVIIICCVSSLAACDYMEIENLFMVSALGFDKTEDENGYKVSAEILKIEGTVGSPKLTSFVMEGGGDSFLSAMAGLMTKAPGKLYLGHCRVIVLGEKLAGGGIGDLIESIFRTPELKSGTAVITTKGCGAGEIINQKAEYKDSISEELDMAMVQRVKEWDGTVKYMTVEIYNKIKSGYDFLLPCVALDNEKKLVFNGSSVIKNGSLRGYLDQDETQCCVLASGRFGQGATLYLSGGTVQSSGMKIERNSNSKRITVKDGRVFINADVQIKCAATGMNNMELGAGGQLQKVTDQIRAEWENKINQTVQKLKNDLKADVFGFKLEAQAQCRGDWEKIGRNWDESFKNADITVTLALVIENNGLAK